MIKETNMLKDKLLAKKTAKAKEAADEVKRVNRLTSEITAQYERFSKDCKDADLSFSSYCRVYDDGLRRYTILVNDVVVVLSHAGFSINDSVFETYEAFIDALIRHLE
jgi:hypothetical protein